MKRKKVHKNGWQGNFIARTSCGERYYISKFDLILTSAIIIAFYTVAVICMRVKSDKPFEYTDTKFSKKRVRYYHIPKLKEKMKPTTKRRLKGNRSKKKRRTVNRIEVFEASGQQKTHLKAAKATIIEISTNSARLRLSEPVRDQSYLEVYPRGQEFSVSVKTAGERIYLKSQELSVRGSDGNLGVKAPFDFTGVIKKAAELGSDYFVPGSGDVFKDSEIGDLSKPLEGLVGEVVTVEFKER